MVTPWIKAIDAGFSSAWPGLTSKLITKHLPPSVNTALGQLHQQYQNTHSIKTNEAPIQPPILHQKTNNTFVSFQPTNTIFSDQTGALPNISSQGCRYIMFVYIYDINTIIMRCLKTKAGAEHLQTFKDVYTLLLYRGLQLKYSRMDNECSAPIKTFIPDNDMEIQPTPPVNAQKKLGRTIHTDWESPSHSRPHRDQPQISATPMVQVDPTM